MAPESRAKIGPSELATKCKGKNKKGVSVCLVTLYRIALGVVLHMLRYCVAVSALAVSHMVGYCMGVAVACAAPYVVGYYVTVTACSMSNAMLGMLSQFGYCIRDTAAAVIARPPKNPRGQVQRTSIPLFAFQFP